MLDVQYERISSSANINNDIQCINGPCLTKRNKHFIETYTVLEYTRVHQLFYYAFEKRKYLH